jgi:hypothetical protein
MATYLKNTIHSHKEHQIEHMTLIETQSKEGNMGKRMMHVHKVIGNGELHIT